MQSSATLYAYRKTQRRCTHCGKANDRLPLYLCSTCADKRHARLLQRHAQGLCIRCGKPCDDPPSRSCTNCASYLRENAWHIYLQRTAPIEVGCCGGFHAVTTVPFTTPCCGRVFFAEVAYGA